MQLTPLCGALGAEVSGVDLSQPLDASTAEGIRAAFFEHHVLLFRGQDLSPERQIALTELLGAARPHPLNTRRTVEGHPEVLVLENRPGKRGARNDYWHSDISHMEEPPLASLLHAIEIPTGRGDTMFCNMCAAHDQLSPGLRATLAELRAMHSGEATYRRALEGGTDALRIDPSQVKPPVSHPVVRTLGETGRKALFVNPHFTTEFEGMTREESAPLLQHIYARATAPENVYRHRWAVGDVVMWDNRATMHYAVRDYDESMPRYLHRTTADGERPV
ncbi:MAG: TauD/TfdA family dioxygenase [Ectothiorhodospiraceae bacterium]|nr:TauD/TfdA family dioxygenase [Ectothiorhodospiraceae bacterium]